MDQDQFVDDVMHALHVGHIQDPGNMQTLEDTAVKLFRAGFSLSDAEAYLRCCEEYDPALDEDVALERMNRIRAKYPSSRGTFLV